MYCSQLNNKVWILLYMGVNFSDFCSSKCCELLFQCVFLSCREVLLAYGETSFSKWFLRVPLLSKTLKTNYQNRRRILCMFFKQKTRHEPTPCCLECSELTIIPVEGVLSWMSANTQCNLYNHIRHPTLKSTIYNVVSDIGVKWLNVWNKIKKDKVSSSIHWWVKVIHSLVMHTLHTAPVHALP